MSINALRFYGIGFCLLAAGAVAACSSDNTGTPATGGTGGSVTPMAGTGTIAGTGTGGSGGSGTAGTNAAMAGATGISFNIKGNAGKTGMLSFRVTTNADSPAANGKGMCPAGAIYDVCHSPAVAIPVTAAGADVTVTWAQLSGGIPVE